MAAASGSLAITWHGIVKVSYLWKSLQNVKFIPTHVMILSLSRQCVSPPLELCTSPARIAASRISAHPAASQAAGTVRRTSAASNKCKMVSNLHPAFPCTIFQIDLT